MAYFAGRLTTRESARKWPTSHMWSLTRSGQTTSPPSTWTRIGMDPFNSHLFLIIIINLDPTHPHSL